MVIVFSKYHLSLSNNYVNSRKFKDERDNVYIAQDAPHHDIFNPVPEYKDFLSRDRKNYFFPEFGFDIDTFENLCSDFVPEDEFPIILNCSVAQLDKFCYCVYKQNFHDTYVRLSLISKMMQRRAYKNLSRVGNATAINTMNTVVDVGSNNNTAQPIQIVLDINKKEQ